LRLVFVVAAVVIFGGVERFTVVEDFGEWVEPHPHTTAASTSAPTAWRLIAPIVPLWHLRWYLVRPAAQPVLATE